MSQPHTCERSTRDIHNKRERLGGVRICRRKLTPCALSSTHAHRAKNIQVFAVLRAYLQSHKVLELRWVEALICIMSVVGAVFSALIVVGAFKVGHLASEQGRTAPAQTRPQQPLEGSHQSQSRSKSEQLVRSCMLLTCWPTHGSQQTPLQGWKCR